MEENTGIFFKITKFIKNIFKKDKNLFLFEEFEKKIDIQLEILNSNCNKILQILYQIEDKEKLSHNSELNLIMPINDLIKEIIAEKNLFNDSIQNLKIFFKDGILGKRIDEIKNKKNSHIYLEKIKLIIFEINESYYRALKFDETIDILELNKDLVENLSGLNILNEELPSNIIFNSDQTLISCFKKISAETDLLQTKFQHIL